MKLKTTSKQTNGDTFTFTAELDKNELVTIKLFIGDWYCCSYYLGTLMEHGNNPGWCVQSGPYLDYLAVNDRDATKLINEARKEFPNDWDNYCKRFSALNPEKMEAFS
jgi:hypothetical protein